MRVVVVVGICLVEASRDQGGIHQTEISLSIDHIFKVLLQGYLPHGLQMLAIPLVLLVLHRVLPVFPVEMVLIIPPASVVMVLPMVLPMVLLVAVEMAPMVETVVFLTCFPEAFDLRLRFQTSLKVPKVSNKVSHSRPRKGGCRPLPGPPGRE